MKGKVVRLYPWKNLKGCFFELEGQPGQYFAEGKVFAEGQFVAFDVLPDLPRFSGAAQAFNLHLAKDNGEPDEPRYAGHRVGKLNYRLDEPVFVNACDTKRAGKGGSQAATFPAEVTAPSISKLSRWS